MLSNRISLQFNQEFVLNVPKRNSSVSIKIKSHHRLSRNKTIGIATFDLSDLEDGASVEKTEAMDNGGSIVAIFERQRNPNIGTQDSGREMHVCLDPLRIMMERITYFPGDVIRGVVRYNCPKKTPISSVRLCFEGKSYVMWTVHTGQSTMVFESRAPLLQHTSILYGSRDYGKKEEVGPNFLLERPFEFRLPTDLAASIERFSHDSIYAHNRYCIKAFVHRSGTSNKLAKVHFTVLPSPSMARLDIGTASLSKIGKEDDIDITMEAQRTAWAGKPLEVKFSLDNTHGAKEIESLELKFKVKRLGYAKHGGRRAVTKTLWKSQFTGKSSSAPTSGIDHEELINEGSLLPVPPGGKREGIIQVPIPNDIPPSLHSTSSPLIQTRFYLKAEVKTDGGIIKSPSGKFVLDVMGLVENPFMEIKSSAEPYQCVMYTPESTLAVTPYLVPENSENGKKLEEALIVKRRHFDFSTLGEPTVPESYLDYDSKFMNSHSSRISTSSWSHGRTAHWVSHSKQGEGLLPAHLVNAANYGPVREDETQKLDESD